MRLFKKVGLLIATAAMAATMLTGCGTVTDAIDSVTSVPDAPQGVQATPENGAVKLEWDSTSKFVAYTVYWSTSPGVTPANGIPIPDASSAFELPLVNGKQYYFIVTARGVKGESKPSKEVKATPSESLPPYIRATVLSYAGQNPPWGHLTMVEVYSSSLQNSPILNATVTVNGVNVPWNAAEGEYAANVAVPFGAPVTVAVTVGGKTYSASGTQYAVPPTMTTPALNATWRRATDNTIAWSGAAPAASSYLVGIMDQSGNFVYPAEGDGPAEVSATTTSYVIPANSLSAGSYYAFTGIGTTGIANNAGSGFVISEAQSGSKLYVGAVATVVPVTVQ